MNRFSEVRFIKSVFRPEELEEIDAEVAFIGRSNVGKSTAINRICLKKELAHTSQRPGKTRSINVYEIAARKWLVDLPGYGYSEGPMEHKGKLEDMVMNYMANRPSLRRVFLIVDGYVGATKLDIAMALWLDKNRVPFFIVANKCDRIGKAKQTLSRRAVAEKMGRLPEDIRWVSAEQGAGMDALSNEIADILELSRESRFRAQKD